MIKVGPWLGAANTMGRGAVAIMEARIADKSDRSTETKGWISGSRRRLEEAHVRDAHVRRRLFDMMDYEGTCVINPRALFFRPWNPRHVSAHPRPTPRVRASAP